MPHLCIHSSYFCLFSYTGVPVVFVLGFFICIVESIFKAAFQKLAFGTSEHVHNEGCLGYDGLCGMFIHPATGHFKGGTFIDTVK